MKKQLVNFKNKFKRLLKSDKSTLHKLNYLTLKIDSPEITKDL